MLTTFILVVHGLISLALVAVILLQQSEGGGLGIGGGNAGGMMTARGAANLLTRSTMILATAFVLTSVLLAVLATTSKRGHVIDTTLAAPATTGAPAAPGGVPLFQKTAPAAPAKPATTPAPTDSVPLAN
ncbi:MAG: preprotein translocase subunit SecG [Sphingomonadaceae bacterium]|nr:preprotein translocase subunit SecG [Sphingomonadaceae bacterium]